VSQDPVNRFDPTGLFDMGVGAIAMSATIAVSLQMYAFSYFVQFMSRRAPRMLITQPVVIVGSSWDESEALTTINDAARFWFSEASILIQAGRPQWLRNENLLYASRGPLEGELPPGAKHYTVFTQKLTTKRGEIAGVSVGVGGKALASMLSYPSASTPYERGKVLAHEWGHALNLPHDPFPGNLMSCPLWDFTRFWNLTDGQVGVARNAARKNWQLVDYSMCISENL